MTNGKPRKWCSDRQIDKMRRGLCPGMTAMDVAAIMEGQANSKIRGYSKHPRVWDETPPSAADVL